MMMLQRLAFAATVAAAVAAASGCYNPSYKEGIACGAGDTCPSGLTCVASRCTAPGKIDAPQAPSDSAVVDGALPDAALPDAALPDAALVGCQGDGDCAHPPDACSTPGTCNLSTHICVFGAVDCSAMTDGCNDGVCNPSAGCVKRPAREGNDCGSGTTCTPFGSCDYTDVCDSSAVQSRVCSDNKCQSGTCTNSSRVEMLPCTRNTANMPCGPTVFNSCSLCTGSSENGCAADGSQTCTCVAQICISDVCQPSTSTCQHACARLAEGAVCLVDPDSCGGGHGLRFCCSAGFCNEPCGCQ